jgi:hypothetical protein
MCPLKEAMELNKLVKLIFRMTQIKTKYATYQKYSSVILYNFRTLGFGFDS